MIRKTTLAAIYFFAFSNPIFSQFVHPDSSFGNAGYVKLTVGTNGTNPFGDDMETNAEGKIFIGGHVNYNLLKVQKISSNGQIDNSFTLTFPEAGYSAVPLAFQKDGKLLIKAGKKIYRYFSSGTPDSTFGTAGFFELTQPIKWYVGIFVLEDDNFIVYGSGVTDEDDNDFVLLKFLKDGAPDTTFGNNGKVVFDFNPQDDDDINITYSMSRFSDGKLLVGGSILNNDGFKAGFLKLHENGTIDSTFANNGSLLTGYLNSAECYKTIITPDDKILFAGYTINSYPNYKGLVARLNSDGSPDTAFGDAGKVLLPGVWEHTTLALKGDRILYGGYKPHPDTFYAYIGGLHYDGTPDQTFGPTGIFTFNKPSKAREIIMPDENTAIVSGHYTYSNDLKIVGRFLLSPIISGTLWRENQQPEILIYPNPVTDLLHLKFEGIDQENIRVSIVDMAGREWYRHQHTVTNQMVNIPLDNGIPTGSYILNIINGNKTLALKIYKQ